jgi:hypothetical protein
MKLIIFSFLILSNNHSYSQILSGDIVDFGRKLLTETDFQLKGLTSGEVVYDISVDIYGNVTAASLVKNMTTIKSTPLRMEAKNLIYKFKFEAGNGFPKFHHTKIKITFSDK